MAEKFIIQGGKPLRGIVEVRGSKNAAGACLAASLMSEEEIIIDNLPLVKDILEMIELFKSLGVKIEFLEPRRIRIKDTSKLDPQKMDFEKIAKTRISVLLIGGLLSRFKKFKIARPGGDRIGLRPISTHLTAFKKLGVEIEEKGEFYNISTRNLEGREIILKEFSVTATENLMMAATLAKGKTKILGAAAEPQVQDLGKMLKNMGAKIEGLGTHTISVEGVERLTGAEHRIIPDPLEAGTFIVAGAVTPGKIEVRNVGLSYLDIFLDKLEEIGVDFKAESDSIKVNFSSNLKPTRIQALPYPGFPTDLLPIVVPLLTQAKGKSLIHDPLYEDRFGYIQELRKMGAEIEVVDPHRAFIFGNTPLKGLKIESSDIRAGASLVIAGLIAQGQTTIENIYQIDRGYERIEQRLQQLGANIRRVKE